MSDALRTRLPEPATTPEHRQEKRRGTCGHPLAFDNPGPLCSACQGRKEAERFAALPKIATLKPKKEVLRMGNITMTPKAMPTERLANCEYDDVIRAFIGSGEPSVVITSPGRLGKSLYATAKAAIERTRETRCYAAVRQGECYLVRKGGVLK